MRDAMVTTTMPPRQADLEPTASTGAVFLALPPVVRLDDDQFYDLCRLNRELRLERAPGGGLSIMPPAGGETSRRNAEIARQLGNWARRTRTGTAFDSSCGFILPNCAAASATAAATRRSPASSLRLRYFSWIT